MSDQGVSGQEDWPYVVTPGLPLLDDSRGYPEAIIGTLNLLIFRAEEAGVRLRLRYRDGKVVDVTGSSLAAIEWMLPSGELFFVEELDVVALSKASEMLGMTRNALYLRMMRAHSRGEDTPFKWSKWSDMWVAERSAVLEWAATWRGRSKIRPSRSKKSSDSA